MGSSWYPIRFLIISLSEPSPFLSFSDSLLQYFQRPQDKQHHCAHTPVGEHAEEERGLVELERVARDDGGRVARHAALERRKGHSPDDHRQAQRLDITHTHTHTHTHGNINIYMDGEKLDFLFCVSNIMIAYVFRLFQLLK